MVKQCANNMQIYCIQSTTKLLEHLTTKLFFELYFKALFLMDLLNYRKY